MIVLPEKPEGLSEFEAFERLARFVLNVPKEDVDRLEAEEKEREKQEKKERRRSKKTDQ